MTYSRKKTESVVRIQFWRNLQQKKQRHSPIEKVLGFRMLLKGKTAVITGSNRGIGKSILEVLAKSGATLWAHSRKPSDEFTANLSALSQETGAKITPIYFDMARP